MRLASEPAGRREPWSSQVRLQFQHGQHSRSVCCCLFLLSKWLAGAPWTGLSTLARKLFGLFSMGSTGKFWGLPASGLNSTFLGSLPVSLDRQIVISVSYGVPALSTGNIPDIIKGDLSGLDPMWFGINAVTVGGVFCASFHPMFVAAAIVRIGPISGTLNLGSSASVQLSSAVAIFNAAFVVPFQQIVFNTSRSATFLQLRTRGVLFASVLPEHAW